MFLRVAVGLLICCLSGLALAHAGGVDEDGCHKDSRDGTHHCHPERAKHAKKKLAYDDKHPPKPPDTRVVVKDKQENQRPPQNSNNQNSNRGGDKRGKP